MKTGKLLISAILLSIGISGSLTNASADERTLPFYQGKTLAHPIISGARYSNAILAFIQEKDEVEGYYCFCDEDDPNANHKPQLLGTFPDSTIESVFYIDLDSDGQITLVLSKSHHQYALRGWRYQAENSYQPLPHLQPVLDRLVAQHNILNASLIKQELGKLPPYDYSMEYPKTGNADVDNLDFTQGKLVGWYRDSGERLSEATPLTDDLFFYKKTFTEKDGLFLTATYQRQQEGSTPGFMVTTVSWQSDPAQFNGTENGAYILYEPGAGFSSGFYQQGVADGPWVTHNADYQSEGNHVMGQQQGPWTVRNPQESATGLMENSQREGRWEVSDGLNGGHQGLSGFDTYLHNQRNGPSERLLAGYPWQKGNYVDDLREGMWITENGEGPYSKGIANGVWTLRTSSGDVQQVPLVEGKKQGEMMWRDGNGKLLYIINYKDDIPDGLYQRYNDSGKMVYQAHYHQQKLHGREIEYYDDGVTLRADRGYRNGELDGENRYYFPNGKPHSISTFDQGREVGLMQEFTAAGVKIVERNSCITPPGGRCGKQQTFNPDGTPLTDNDYLFGRQQTHNSWYASGQREEETRIGADDSYTQISYYPNGQISCIVRAQGFTSVQFEGKDYKDYQDAKREGESACYYQTGKLKSSATWKAGKLISGCEKRFDESGEQIFPGPDGCPKPKWQYD